MTRPVSTLCLTTLVYILASGCGTKPAPDPLGSVPSESPKAVSVGPLVTVEDANAFAKDVESCVAQGDVAGLGKLLRIEEMIDRCVSDLRPPASFMAGMKAGMAKSGNSLALQIVDTVKKGGTYTLLRMRVVDGAPRPLFRLILPVSGVNYHEFALVRYPDGRVGTEDIHVAMSGEPLSQTFRRLIVPIIRESKQGMLDRIAGKDKLYLDNAPKVKQITDLRTQGKNQDALNLIRSLPSELEKEKSFQIMAIAAAQQISEGEYLKALDRFRELYPSDPAVDMLSVDYYGLRKEFVKSHACIDRLDKAVGGDPYLQYLHGGIDILAEKWPEAMARFAKAKDAEPTLADAYKGEITVSLKQRDHKATLACLQEIVIKLGVIIDPDSIRMDETFREFVQSPMFGDWQNWLAKRKP